LPSPVVANRRLDPQTVMDLLGGYADSDEESQPPASSSSASSSSSSSSGSSRSVNPSSSSSSSSSKPPPVKTKKSKKKMGFLSILPSEIANALLRGDTARDSDDDDNIIITASKTSIASSAPRQTTVPAPNGTKNLADDACPLLGLLPTVSTGDTKDVFVPLRTEQEQKEDQLKKMLKKTVPSSSSSSFNFEYKVSGQKRALNVHEQEEEEEPAAPVPQPARKMSAMPSIRYGINEVERKANRKRKGSEQKANR
jgi:hypothetical protein